MKKTLYRITLIAIFLLALGCITDDPSSDSDPGFKGDSFINSSLTSELINNYTELLAGENFNISDITAISNNASNRFIQENLTNSNDILLIGQAFLNSIERDSLNSSNLNVNQSNLSLSGSLTPAYKIRAVELAIETLIQALPANINNVSTNSSNVNFATTSYKYSFVIQTFTDLAIQNLDEAGVVSDYLRVAVQGIMQTVTSNLLVGGLSEGDIPEIIKETTQAAMGAIMQTGVTSAEVPEISQKMVYGTMLGIRTLEMGDTYVGSLVPDILQGVSFGMEEASITGAFQELVVKGIKDGVDDGIDVLTDLSTSQKKSIYDDIQTEATGGGSDLALFESERIENIEIVLDRLTAPKGGYITFSVRGHYYAADGYEELTEDPDMHLYINPYFTQSGNNLIATTPGSGTITAIYDTFSETITITAAEAEIVEIEIQPRFTSLPLGQEIDFNIIATYSDGVTTDVSSSSSWGVNKTSNTTLSSTGDFRTTEYGNVEIIVSKNGLNDALSFSISDAVLAALDISPKNTAVPLGFTEQYTVTGRFTDDSQTVINEGLVWINANFNGVATGITEGDHIISVSQAGITTNTTLTVTPKRLHRLVVFPENFELAKGEERRYTATGVYTDDTLTDKSNLVTWEVSYPGLAIINDFRTPGDNGLLETMQTQLIIDSFKETTVTATCDSDCANDLYQSTTLIETTLLRVNKQALTHIEIIVPQSEFFKGQSMQLGATGFYTDNSSLDITASEDCTWSSSDEFYVKMTSDGAVRGDAVGASVIKLDCGTVSEEFTLNVLVVTLDSISLTSVKDAMKEGTFNQLTAVGTFSDGSESDLTVFADCNWSSGDQSIGTISQTGLVTGVSPGKVDFVINCPSENISQAISITIIEALLTGITISPLNDNPHIKNESSFFIVEGLFDNDSSKILVASELECATSNSNASCNGGGGTQTIGMNELGVSTLYFSKAGIQGSLVINIRDQEKTYSCDSQYQHFDNEAKSCSAVYTSYLDHTGNEIETSACYHPSSSTPAAEASCIFYESEVYYYYEINSYGKCIQYIPYRRFDNSYYYVWLNVVDNRYCN